MADPLDAAVEVYLRAVYTDGWIRARGDELRAQVCAGLTAALPSLGAATRPPMCGDAVMGVGNAVLVCTKPADHGGWHGDWNGCQWSGDGEYRAAPDLGPYRTGRKVGRTIYRQAGPEPSDGDVLIGMMDTPELAAAVVAAMNAANATEGHSPSG